VLVVDDNHTNRLILSELLQSWRMVPAMAPSGAEALDLLAHAAESGQPFPLVLLDGHMPEMDGFTVAERIRQDPRLAGAVIMMLTSGAYPDDVGRCRDLGIEAYVTKPVRPSSLLDAIATALGPDSPAIAASPSPITEVVVGVGAALRILLAEDNRVNQVVARRHLERLGHEVVVVENGALAVELSAREHFDVILMDVQMPVMGGFEATAAIRERERGSPMHLSIVGLTAHAMQGDRERCLEAGMDDYATKPIDSATLRATLARVVRDGHIDLTALRAALGDDELLRELAHQFCDSGRTDLALAREAQLQGNLSEVFRLAHRLAGGASEFRAKPAVAACREMERLAHEGDSPAVPAAIDQVAIRLGEVFKALEAELPLGTG
jgi:CheY-like chemotaxis protein